MTEKYICIHGHFYQPPRENPWIEEIEQQDSAYPYHDWNERITFECYAPNTASRKVDNRGMIIDITNNYSKISFNFGPTLLSWFEKHNPEVYKSIIDADKESRKLFSGHGSAMAQVYNHLIMPLANRKDKETQVVWGIKDFIRRFKREPEGMWLSETAVDMETLNILAEQGIKFTILAPSQAHRVRKLSQKQWTDVSSEKIDPHFPYVCNLEGGKQIAIFFYDGPVSREISFSDLLSNGENFANRLLSVFSEKQEPQILTVASDGETYGHHHRFGEMALTYCLRHIEQNKLAKISVPGEYLEKFPPQYEVEIFESSSWSCAHGVERWRSDCGCQTGGKHGWNQKWRQPLRDALDWLRDTLVPLYKREMSVLVHDPWKARNDYIDVILNREIENIQGFIGRHKKKDLSKTEKIKLFKLLEMQRHAMLMYTSCGWFFSEISGIETTQIMSYAACAINRAKEISGIELEENFMNILKNASSNIKEFGNGAEVYARFVKPSTADMQRVAAHYAVSSLFEDYAEKTHFFCYTSSSRLYQQKQAGLQRIAAGRAVILSHITWEEIEISFAILHLGDHNIIGGTAKEIDEGKFQAISAEIDSAFMKSDIAEVIRIIEKNFGSNNCSLWHLFKDEQRKILNQVLQNSLQEKTAQMSHTFKQFYPLMQVLKDMSMPLPKVLSTTAEFTLNTELCSELRRQDIDIESLKNIISEIKKWSVELDKTTVCFNAIQCIKSNIIVLTEDYSNTALIEKIQNLLDTLSELRLDLNLWCVQNAYFFLWKKLQPKIKSVSESGDDKQKIWKEKFLKLGQSLYVAISQ